MNYTVGTQKMNTYCKRRSKASYRKYILFHRKKYWLCLTRKILLVKNFFPWQENFSCDRKFLIVTGNCFLWQEMFPVTEYFSCDRKFFFSDREFHPVTENSFLWKAFFLLWHQISSCDRKFLPVNWVKNHTPLS